LDAFTHPDLWKRAREMAYGALTCMGRHTLTGILTASGKQFTDWSAAYRLFSHQRIDIEKIFDVARENTLKETGHLPMIIAHMDDTIIKKTGRHVPGASWRRDPLGPPFNTNFIWGQRFLQISMALPHDNGQCQSRAIPIDFHHCPTAKKPSSGAEQAAWDQYKEVQKKIKLSKQGIDRIHLLREKLDQSDFRDKQLVLSVDGSYTNTQVLKGLPKKVTLIGRIRKDTKLFNLPDNQPHTGRKRVYGEQLPTPDQIRQSEQYPWQEVKAWAAGKTHNFNVKVVNNIRWRSAGEKHDLMLVVIRPLGYRLTKLSKVLYRQPAYLICTDTKLDLQSLLQAYLWRWEIEVNFREQKSLLGCGQAQVRKASSAENVPAFIAAIYALLHIANHRSAKVPNQKLLPRPKWYANKNNSRITTGDLINNLRAQLWAKAVGISFSGFVNLQTKTQNQRNTSNPLNCAQFYMRN